MRKRMASKLLPLALLWISTAATVAMGQANSAQTFPRNAPLTGTWFVTVPDGDGGVAFSAYQTFNADGTMTETSDLLATLAEGPAHGVWTRRRGTYYVTFELFAFDEDHAPAGRIRVRAELNLTTPDHFEAFSAVDIILPDGTEITDIGQSPFSGDRVQIRDLAGNLLASDSASFSREAAVGSDGASR